MILLQHCNLRSVGEHKSLLLLTEWEIANFREHTQLVVRAGILGLRVRRADYSATLPPHGTIPELQQ